MAVRKNDLEMGMHLLQARGILPGLLGGRMMTKDIRDDYLEKKFFQEFTELLEEVRKLRIAMEKLRREESSVCGDWYFNH